MSSVQRMVKSCVVLAGACLLASSARAQDSTYKHFDPLDKKWQGKYQLAMECQKCHTQPTLAWKDAMASVILTEYPIWKTHDDHAQAFAILFGSRSRQMGKILGGSEDYVLKPEAGCLNCHAMANLMSKPEDIPSPAKLKEIIKANKPEESRLPFDGVGCGGCHGPSTDWNTEHIDPKKWRFKLNPEEKAKVGFWDLRDAETRSTLCMSCHVGNVAEGKVVTHAMFAAGHPPLPPIEIALFSKNEPQHWRDAKDVPYFKKAVEDKNEETIKNYHLQDFDFQQTKLALVGGVVSLRETMRLVRDRANLDASRPQQVWPELLFGLDEKDAKNAGKVRELAKSRWPDIALAHSDCYACHHDLKFPGYRQERGYGFHLNDGLVRTRPGRPVVRAWPTVMVETALAHAGGKQGEFRTRLQALVDSWQSQPFGKPEAIAKAADELVKWSDTVIASLKASRFDKDSARKLIAELLKHYGPGAPAELIPDYETARQVVALLTTIYTDYQAAGGDKDPDVAALLAKLADQVDLHPYKKRNERLQVVLDIIKQKSEVKPTDESLVAFNKYLSNIGDAETLRNLMLKPNAFVLAIGFVSNEAVTDGFIAASDKLQALSDEELAIYLKTVNDYNPSTFRAIIGELQQKLK